MELNTLDARESVSLEDIFISLAGTIPTIPIAVHNRGGMEGSGICASSTASFSVLDTVDVKTEDNNASPGYKYL